MRSRFPNRLFGRPSVPPSQHVQHSDTGAPREGVWADTQRPAISDWLDANGSAERPYSYDWCRFRRNSHCYFTDLVDHDASQEAGYAVYVPMDRGTCWRAKWNVQANCDAAQPGPHANDSKFVGLGGAHGPAYTDATVPWEAMGQQGTESAADYAPPRFAAWAPWLKDGPRPLTPLERVAPHGGPQRVGEEFTSPTLTNAGRVRALGDLVQLRTGGYLSQSEFQSMHKRIDSGRNVRTSAVPLGSRDALVQPADRLASLHGVGVLSTAERDLMLQRIGEHEPASPTAPTPNQNSGTPGETRQPHGGVDVSTPEAATALSDELAPLQNPASADVVGDAVQALQPLIREAARRMAASLIESPLAPVEQTPSMGPGPDRVCHLEQGGASSATPMTLAEQLETMAELHQSGSLTDEEFAEAKRQLLRE